jgi:hypothetical protein
MIKIFKVAGLIVAISLALLILLWRFVPPKIFDRISQDIGPIADVISQYPVQIRGDAMMPLFHHGQRITLSRRIEDRNNIPIGTIILYQRPAGLRLSVIRERIVDANGVGYRVSQQARQQETEDIRADRIIALYNRPQ